MGRSPESSDGVAGRGKKDHRQNTVGPWARQKLAALESYLIAYMNVMKNQRFELVYVDAFAGAGIAKVRGSAEPADAPPPALLGEEDEAAAEEFILGSPRRALGLDRPFDNYHFIDLDPRRASVLGQLQAEFPNLDIRVESDEANAAVQRIAAGFGRWNLRGVAFLDPYGAHLHWATLEALAGTGKFDVIINLPMEMAINRLLPRDCGIRPSWRAQLDACFGTADWFEEAYAVETNLLGESVVKRPDAAKRLVEFYVRRVDALFGNSAGPSLVRNTRGNPLYHLIWAASNPTGKPIAKHILGLGERVRVRRDSAYGPSPNRLACGTTSLDSGGGAGVSGAGAPFHALAKRSRSTPA